MLLRTSVQFSSELSDVLVTRN